MNNLRCVQEVTPPSHDTRLTGSHSASLMSEGEETLASFSISSAQTERLGEACWEEPPDAWIYVSIHMLQL